METQNDPQSVKYVSKLNILFHNCGKNRQRSKFGLSFMNPSPNNNFAPSGEELNKCIQFRGSQFEEAFENTQWIKVTFYTVYTYNYATKTLSYKSLSYRHQYLESVWKEKWYWFENSNKTSNILRWQKSYSYMHQTEQNLYKDFQIPTVNVN